MGTVATTRTDETRKGMRSMLKKSIITAAAAAILVVGTVGGTATSALAKDKGHNQHQSYQYRGKGGGYHPGGNPGYHRGGNGGYAYHQPQKHAYPYHPRYRWNRGWGCTPQYRMVRVWKPHHGWVNVRTYVGRACWW